MARFFALMSISTHGLRVRRGPQSLRAAVELFSSMRFAISLLTIICIASIIGTVLKQHEPIGNYINQFGPFWSELFHAAKLDVAGSGPGRVWAGFGKGVVICWLSERGAIVESRGFAP